MTDAKSATAAAKANKSRHLASGEGLTCAGSKLSPAQVAVVNDLLDTGVKYNAPLVCMHAIIYAGIGETRLGNVGAYVKNSIGLWGVLQSSPKDWPDPHDVKGQATSFMNGGKGFQSGGAIALSATTTNPAEIAIRVEVPSIWPKDAYATQTGGSAFMGEARAIVAAYGGATARSTTTAATATSAGPTHAAKAVPKPVNDVAQLSRGTADNPDETSWDAIQRLADEVKWFAFSNGSTLYYMDGPDLDAQQPLAILTRNNDNTWGLYDMATGRKTLGIVNSLSYTVDDTAFAYRSTRVVNGVVQRAKRTAAPSTPTEIQLNLICDIDYVRGGDVILVHNAGPATGRWIVTDCTRNCFADPFSQLTLGPPTAPDLEPRESASPFVPGDVPGATKAPTGSNPTKTNTSTQAPKTGGNSQFYVDPFSKVTNLERGRIDMGVDYGGSGTILAIGDGRIGSIYNSGWKGVGTIGAFIELTLAAGPYKGKVVYYSENINPAVKSGQVVSAGDKIGTMVPTRLAGGAIEIGWAVGDGGTALAHSLGQDGSYAGLDAGAWSSRAGCSFNRFLKAVGAPTGVLHAGDPETGHASGKAMPPGYP